MTDSQSPGDVNKVGLPKHLIRSYLAQSALAALPIEELDLSLRSYNVLKANRVNTIGRLALLSDRKLLKLQSFGRKSLIGVHSGIDKFLSIHAANFTAAGEGTLLKDQTSDSSNVDALQFTCGGWKLPYRSGLKQYHTPAIAKDVMTSHVESLDLSLRSLNVLNRLGIAYIGELLAYPKSCLFEAHDMGRQSLEEIESKLFAYLLDKQETQLPVVDQNVNPESMKSSPGTRVFVDRMLSLLSVREKSIIAGRYGLWDSDAKTLRQIGDKLGVTRECVRKIEEKGLKRLRRVYGHDLIQHFISGRIASYQLSPSEPTHGILAADEIARAFADDCSPAVAKLAFSLLRDVNTNPSVEQLVEAEPDVYCVNDSLSAEYRKFLKIIERELQRHQKPLLEEALYGEFDDLGKSMSEKQSALLSRLFQVSPSVMRLGNGLIALSQWTKFHGCDPIRLIEAKTK